MGLRVFASRIPGVRTGFAGSTLRFPHAPPAAADVSDARLATWSFLWAAAILFSLTSGPGWFRLLSTSFPAGAWFRETTVAVLALLVMLFPRSIGLLSMLAVAQVAQVFDVLPAVANHRLIACFVNLALLIAVAEACQEGRPAAGVLWRRFVPVARGLVLLVYCFAFVAKLNRDFLDPGASCAVQFYEKIVYWLPMLPRGEGVGTTIAWVTLIVEGTLPLLLAIPRFRVGGVVLGLIFHIALSFDLLQHLVNFSATMAALLVLFLPDACFARLAERWRGLAGGVPGLGALRAVCCLSFLTLMAIAFRGLGNDAFALAYYGLRQVMFVTYAGALLVAALALGREAWPAGRRPLPRGAAALSLLALALVNGLSPYLGLKTRTSFSMYSNLRMEAEGSNHFVAPRSLDLLGMLSDTVTVVETNDPVLWSQTGARGSKITWFEFTSHVNRTPHIRVLYERNGEARYLDSGRGVGMPPPPPPLLRKLLFFAPVGVGVERECLW